MAKPTTTHVIEIETGIGEPAFIPLSMGNELQPISVGKKGMWRIESARVLDVHAFVYFDGTSLFLQSADDANAASVDGFRVGKAWTELHAPCKIEIGVARLRYRSLMADDQPTQPVEPPPASKRQGGPPSAPGSRPRASVPPAQPAAAPVASAKAERPFRPGEFSSSPEINESTRVAPLEATGGARGGSGPPPRSAPGAGPAENVEGGRSNTRAIAAVAAPPVHGGPQAGTAMIPGQGQVAPDGMQPVDHGLQHGLPSGPPPYAPSHHPQAPYGAMQGPGMPQGPMGGFVPGVYGSMTPQGVHQPQASPGGVPGLLAKLKQNAIAIAAGLIFIVGGILYLVGESGPPKGKPAATLDAGGPGPAVVVQPPLQPMWPAGVPCPPPNWPPNTPLPCTPNPATQQQADPAPPARDGGKTPAIPALAAGAKTLERQAVDLVAAGEMAKAAAAYEELVRRDPNNKVYAEAARILRAKLDASAP